MRIVIFTHGTRGDVWPAVALGTQLLKQGHEVTVGTAGEFQGLVERAGLGFGRLPVNLTEHLASPQGQRLLHGGSIAFLRDVQRLYNTEVAATDDAFERLGRGADALLTTPVTLDRTQALADAGKVPMGMVYPFPVLGTSAYSSPSITSGHCRSPLLRRASHDVTSWVWWRTAHAEATAFRRRLGLPPATGPTDRRHLAAGGLALCSWSPVLVPRPADFPPGAHQTGAWTPPAELRSAAAEGLPADLVDWIGSGDPPVFLGFGSMPVLQPGPLLDDVVAVTRSLGVRAIVSADWVGRDDLDLPDHVRLVGAVDHDRLLPLCAAAVHHGGAGTVAASTRAGCPTVVCSVFVDQPWWGERLTRLGVGAHVPFKKLDRVRLEAALTRVLQPEVRERARVLGEAIRAEGDGLPAAAAVCHEWLRTAEPTPLAAASGRRRRHRATA